MSKKYTKIVVGKIVYYIRSELIILIKERFDRSSINSPKYHQYNLLCVSDYAVDIYKNEIIKCRCEVIDLIEGKLEIDETLSIADLTEVSNEEV